MTFVCVYCILVLSWFGKLTRACVYVVYWISTLNKMNWSFIAYAIKLRMEMGNVSKRQQPDYRTDNSRRSPTGLQCSEKFPHPETKLV